ncbi:nicotinamide-nucleotide adenylyltransferase, partial [Acinetobacter baumannii]
MLIFRFSLWRIFFVMSVTGEFIKSEKL